MDITIDLETCALCPTAAVMSIGAVAWDRNNAESPFFDDCLPDGTSAIFNCHVDLRGMFVDGFAFDSRTQQWWAHKSRVAKESLLAADSVDAACEPVDVAVGDLFGWIERVKRMQPAEDVFLWSQGTDFDIAILRNICYRYGMEMPVSYRNFRDHRTFAIEGCRLLEGMNGECVEVKDEPTDLFHDKLHDPVYDCQRSIYGTWQIMQFFSLQKKQSDEEQ